MEVVLPTRLRVREPPRINGGREKHPTASRQPLVSVVLYDIEQIIMRFESNALRTFAAFKSLATEMRVLDLFTTRTIAGRIPPRWETVAEYSTLLFEAVVRRVVEPERTFGARLGALYLLLVLHELQPGGVKAPVPILESQWTGFERLASELRTTRHADGFKALHMLWAGGRLSYRVGSATVVNARDQLHDHEAERDAMLLPARAGTDLVGTCPFALQLTDALAGITELEANYEAARRELGTAGRAPAASRSGDGISLAEQLRQELDYYRNGQWPAELLAAGAAEQLGTQVDEAYIRREQVRHRPFAPSRNRTKDGGHQRGRSSHQ